VTDKPASGNDGDHRVVPFRRARRPWPASGPADADPAGRLRSPPDLAQYERTGEDDDYRHRMIVNGAALAFTVLLAFAGMWLASKMAELRKNQDCVLAGRSNCAQIDVRQTTQ
jgi:hypothetical protein